MKSSWWMRFSLFVVVLAVSVTMIIPTVFDFSSDGKFPVKSKINLGLDLQGGLYMVLGIDFNQVYQDEVKGYIRKFEYLLKDRGEIESRMGEADFSNPKDPKYSIIIGDASKVEDAHQLIKKNYRNAVKLTKKEGGKLQYGLQDSLKSTIEDQSISKSIEVIRNRIDEFGVTEPEIISQGSDRIVVQLPGVKDIERAKALIGKTAKLEFRIVYKGFDPIKLSELVKKAEDAGIVYTKKDRFSNYLKAINEFLKKDIPEGYELAFQRKINNMTNETEAKLPFLVKNEAELTGDELQDAHVQIDQQRNMPYVALSFKAQGAKRFEDVTGENVGKQLAVILDGNVYTAPVIDEKIAGGHASIRLGGGDYNHLIKQGRDIALVLRAGALPVTLNFEEQRVVGPSLGSTSIERAEMAGIVGCLAIFIFAIVYYKVSGVMAIMTLILNVLIILATLVGLEATLTLPGIAGIVLTVGMAIDATIIIYERIREELRKKDTNNFKAMESGFNMAFWTIVDANITTAIAGFCLLNFGTGPIRGFAVTLLVGICATVYSAYFVGRLLFEFYLNRVGGRDLSI